MAEYIDENFLAADGVLLAYIGNEASITVPAVLGGMRIHSIGRGAFSGRRVLRKVRISEGIRVIRYDAFNACANLEKVILAHSVERIDDLTFYFCDNLTTVYQILIYTEEEYERLLTNCVSDGDTRYMALKIPKIGRNFMLRERIFGLGKTHRMPQDITRLFKTQQNYCGNDQKVGVFEDLKNVFFPKRWKQIDDEAEALANIRFDGFPAPDPKTEKANDEHKKEVYIRTMKSMVLMFDTAQNRRENGLVYVVGEYSLGLHFWQELIPVEVKGEAYTMYARCCLGAGDLSDRELDYVRAEVCPCDLLGRPLTDEREIQNVFREYKKHHIIRP
ncbi:MAG: leucine-rich repeat protein [Lachnospiraceae bacterium]|nr:leucine-rich repeat protein [Lachnospiraceae bacterium]